MMAFIGLMMNSLTLVKSETESKDKQGKNAKRVLLVALIDLSK